MEVKVVTRPESTLPTIRTDETRIRVRTYDASGVLLAQQEAYAWNILKFWLPMQSIAVAYFTAEIV